VKIGAMEFATAIDHMPLNWNIFTGKWLKYYFYTRLLSAGWKRMANPITFLVSAFWHGFYPGYYMLFAFGPLTAIMASRT
jgi:lysophospholipid acyltransferase